MKKIYSLLLAVVATLGITTSCSDVPMPYDINQDSDLSFGKKLPYKSANLNSGWTTQCISENEPWSKGSNYIQATGFQAWDGSTKTNAEVESYLISPALNTKCESGKVRISFDHTIRYNNIVSGWVNYHKIYITDNYQAIGSEFDINNWVELTDFKPAASTTNDWTLYSSGYIQVPDQFVNKDSVYVAFYFYAPASASTTWELENFLIEEGEATDMPDTPGNPSDDEVTEITCAQAKELCNALEDGGTSTETYSVTGYITDVYSTISKGQQSFWMDDTKDGGKVLQAYWANLPEGVQSFTKGSKVKITGQLLKYVKDGNVTAEIKNATVEILENTQGGNDQPSDGIEVSCADAAKLCNALSDGGTSTETYSVTGYITDVYSSISRGQQSFWMDDTKDGGKVLQAYWANLPEGVQSFTKGSKVKITGQLLKYVKDGDVTPEIKNANVVILDNNEGGNQEEKPGDNTGSSNGVSINGTTVTLTNDIVTAGGSTVTLVVNELNLADKSAAVGTYTIPNSDGATITIDKGNGKTAPTYYSATNGFRIYASNTITIKGTSTIAKIEMVCDSYSGTNYVGNKTATVSFSGNEAVYCNFFEGNSGGTQLRVQKIIITYAATSAKNRK